ncbi:MAG: bifunctional 5,10-methylenetetrahydrofolate dehydrogenase/5,10-methenyltetrahydrofolate cyclohydrolase [Candidatus Omnitrophota bacterium]
MPARLLEGKIVAQKIRDLLAEDVRQLKAKTGEEIRLFSIAVAGDAASEVYGRTQCRMAESVGILCEHCELGADAGEEQLLDIIREKNAHRGVTGIVVQRPLPDRFDIKKVQRAIEPLKDVEGLHPQNLGRVMLGDRKIVPCTALACCELIESTGVELYGKEAVVVGHSDIVGKPLSLMLLGKFLTTTVCHVATSDSGRLEEHCRRADVLVVAVGKPGLIKGAWVKEGSIVIDVGINRESGKLVGDVEFDEARKRAAFITPVPGGVGPLTVAMLMRNVVDAARIQLSACSH